MALDWSWLSHFEWIIVEVLVLGLLVWQLSSVRREIRDDRQKPAAPTEDDEEY